MGMKAMVTGHPRLAAAAAVVVLSAGGWAAWRRWRPAKPSARPEASSAKVERGDIELHFTDSGELAPKSSVDVASKVSGRVIELLVDEGSRVRKDARLAVVQPGRTEAERYVPFTVTSPIEGVVMRYQRQGAYEESRIAKLGDYVTGLLESNSPTYLMTIADLSRLVVRMKISEMDILKLREGMAVKVTVDALPGETFPARVTLVSPQAEKDSNNLKNFRVEVSIEGANSRLKPGMTAKVDGLLDSRKGVLKLTLAAVFEERGSEVAYVEQPDGKHRRAVLKLGLRNETDVEILDGLKEGDSAATEKPEEAPGKPGK